MIFLNVDLINEKSVFIRKTIDIWREVHYAVLTLSELVTTISIMVVLSNDSFWRRFSSFKTRLTAPTPHEIKGIAYRSGFTQRQHLIYRENIIYCTWLRETDQDQPWLHMISEIRWIKRNVNFVSKCIDVYIEMSSLHVVITFTTFLLPNYFAKLFEKCLRR